MSFGCVGAVPEIPENINQILNQPCPFNPGQLIKDTHILTLMPATLDGESLTIQKLGQIITNPKTKNKASLDDTYNLKTRLYVKN